MDLTRKKRTAVKKRKARFPAAAIHCFPRPDIVFHEIVRPVRFIRQSRKAAFVVKSVFTDRVRWPKMSRTDEIFRFFFVKSLHFRKKGIYYWFLNERKRNNFNIDEV